MRDGLNPNRHRKVYEHPANVAAAIVHLPEGDHPYHRERMNIVKLSLVSMREYAFAPGTVLHDRPHILVWANGCAPEMLDWLSGIYQPDTLVISPNVGKTSARTAIFRMFSPGTYVAVADDDMLYSPGWMAESLRILHAFPPAVVSAYPTRAAMSRNNKATLAWAKQHANLERGHYIPDAWTVEYGASIAAREEVIMGLLERKDGNLDQRIEYKGLRAFATSHHCQMMARAGDVLPYLNWDDQGSTNENLFDRFLDEGGLLRLATTQHLAQHMGNVLDSNLRRYISEMGLLNFEELKDVPVSEAIHA